VESLDRLSRDRVLAAQSLRIPMKAATYSNLIAATLPI
jgi:hypothetical protein